MLLEDSASGFCGLVYTQAVTPRVYIFQFVKFMLIILFWKSIHFLLLFYKLIPRCNNLQYWVLLSNDTEIEK